MRVAGKDRIGQKFGMLTITGVYVSDKYSMAKVLCECGNENDVRICALTSGNTISCGCKRKSDFNERNKTDEKVLRDGREITLRNYLYFHRRLVAKYGKPQKCEFNTTHLAKRFEYALKKGSQYSENREDYFELCPSCHRKYDFTETIRQNISKGQKGKSCKSLWIPIIQKDKNGSIMKVYPSITEAIKSTKVDHANLFRALRGERKSAGGYIWEYTDN